MWVLSEIRQLHTIAVLVVLWKSWERFSAFYFEYTLRNDFFTFIDKHSPDAIMGTHKARFALLGLCEERAKIIVYMFTTKSLV